MFVKFMTPQLQTQKMSQLQNNDLFDIVKITPDHVQINTTCQ
jgi:hypothetical protein